MEHILFCSEFSDTHKCFGVVVQTMAMVFGAIFFGSALVRGVYRHLTDLFGFHGFFRYWLKRNAPYNKTENVVSAIITSLKVEPETWTVSDGTSKISNGKVIVNKPFEDNWVYDDWYGYIGPSVEIKGDSKYHLKDVRPALLRELATTVHNLHTDRIANMVLETCLLTKD